MKNISFGPSGAVLDLLIAVRMGKIRVRACDACGTLAFPRRMDVDLRARIEALAAPVALAILDERRRAVGFVEGLNRWDAEFDGGKNGPSYSRLRTMFADLRESPWGKQLAIDRYQEPAGISREEMEQRARDARALADLNPPPFPDQLDPLDAPDIWKAKEGWAKDYADGLLPL